MELGWYQMPYDPKIHHRRSIRLPDFDYSQGGAYFVTIVTSQRGTIFGNIEDQTVSLNEVGRMVETEWLRLSDRFHGVGLDEWVVMPDHFHGIVWLKCKAPGEGSSEIKQISLGTLIRAFKSSTTQRARWMGGLSAQSLWQRNYYERVLRDENELMHARGYILDNPISRFP